ncbi:MAG: DSD1 family PLP-dependent enzyme [SAR324 cluster bacterium]|nr:DSD1 family PLP-dependent enzyme [SAR324 cluster bacterium]
MTVPPPAEIGVPLHEVDTPALLIELDAFERNLAAMAGAVEGFAPVLRPHSKTHKCPEIALRQIALGAVGVCCQKVSEAEAMVEGGVSDVLVSNEVVGAPKIARLAALARRARVGVCVDDADNVQALGRAAAEAGVELQVLVEINVGANRCGVEPGQPALALAEKVAATPGLSFSGLQAYQGSAQHIREQTARQAAIATAAGAVAETVELLGGRGLNCPVVAGAGTGSYRCEAASGVYTELQAGSYIFMDADYARNLGEDGQPLQEFEHSLFIHTTVMSQTAPGRAVVDAGLKAHSVDSGMPWVHGLAGVSYAGASDEHGKLAVAQGAATPRVGDKIRLIPGHCDPTVNLYDWYVGMRNGKVESLWPITARGMLY